MRNRVSMNESLTALADEIHMLESSERGIQYNQTVLPILDMLYRIHDVSRNIA